jgi:hypothetical protein
MAGTPFTKFERIGCTWKYGVLQQTCCIGVGGFYTLAKTVRYPSDLSVLAYQ